VANPTISSRYAERILDTAQRAGIDRSDLLGAAPLAPVDRFGDPRITGLEYYTLWGAAMERVGDAEFPLRVASSTGIETYEVFGFACMTSSTFRDGLLAASRYLRIWTDLATWDLRIEDRTARLCLVAAPVRHRASRFAAECALAEVLHTSRAYLGVTWSPAAVELPWRRPPDASANGALQQFFGAQVVFERPHPALVFDADLLSLPLVKADPTMASFFAKYADELLARAPAATSLVSEVKRRIATNLTNGTPALGKIAKELATSERTLRRRLADEGHTFAELVQETRCALAKQHLEEDRISIAEIAFVLGFSDVTAFHRSFRRWTGATPAAYRGKSA
jgi:AraC-like DNA-binding protein